MERLIINGKKSDISLEPKFIDGRLDLNEVGNIRTIKDEFSPEEQAWEINTDDGDTYVKIGQRFTLRDSCENGDGTVPLRAGQIVHKNILERLAVQVSLRLLIEIPLVRHLHYVLL